ncbi:hypothetical protein V5F41_12445 [Xanthobacter autotrophicus]|uniref:hypothetical protein n=1 Tax=Xanthobacter autotrophicus TaxID=280 RepID=UPI00372C4543
MADARELFVFRIKAVTRDLIKLCGGVERSGEIASRSKSVVSRWQIPTEAEIIDLPAAIALESECGMPLVTSVMAETHGRRLTDEAAMASAASLNARHSELLRAQGETSIHMAAALEDGTITPAEAEILDRAASNQEEALRRFRAGLSAVRADGPKCPAAPLHVVRG